MVLSPSPETRGYYKLQHDVSGPSETGLGGMVFKDSGALATLRGPQPSSPIHSFPGDAARADAIAGLGPDHSAEPRAGELERTSWALTVGS